MPAIHNVVTVPGAISYCILYSVVYVISIYLLPANIKALGRENHKNIAYRLCLITLSTALIVLVSFYDIARQFSFERGLFCFGLQLRNFVSSLTLTIMLMIFFYTGPIVAYVWKVLIGTAYEIAWSGLLRPRPSISALSLIYNDMIGLRKEYHPMIILRNLIIAPITEELVFRAVIISNLFLAYSHMWSETGQSPSPMTVALQSPIYFGVAHLHHLYEKLSSGGSVTSAIVSSLVQFTYTSIFGFIAALLFMRTGNLASPIASHVICNFMQLPDIGFLFPPNSKDNRCTELSCLYDYRYVLLFLHAGGLVLFGCLLFPMTEAMAHTSMYWT